MNIYTIDAETSIKCPVGKHQAHPMWPLNKVVAMGAWDHARGEYALLDTKHPTAFAPKVMLVGHNIKFDLLYMYRDFPKAVLPYIWDTQLAEYIITGQKAKYASLNSLIIKYLDEGRLKDDRLKEFWDNGVNTEDIPMSILLPYLENDVLTTKDIFQKQWEVAKEQGQTALILTQMEALRATTAMNLRGMAIDWDYVDMQRAGYGHHIEELEKELPAGLDYKSPKELSLFFFGGVRKEVERQLVGQYKNGKDKYRNVEVIKRVHGVVTPIGDAGKNGYYSSDDKVLETISTTALLPSVRRIASVVSSLRKAQKIKETYYEGLSSLRFPNSLIYPNLNHTSTGTGRLSCTNPNLQNQTEEGDVKKAYVSRYGGEGRMVELDYSQLEMVWLAFVADDAQLADDINNGQDMHTELFRDMYGRAPSKAERKAFKRRSFRLVYGAGAAGIAMEANITVAEAKEFIKVFYGRYKGVAAYHKRLLELANANKEIFYKEGVAGPFHRYTHVMPWGRRYVFETYDNEWSKERTFSPTELKNYMVQGSATGDMVPLMVGIVQRKLEEAGYWQEGTAQMVMTVHDSILLDVHVDVLDNVIKLAKTTLEDAPKYVKHHFNIDFPCALSSGVEVGINWQDKEEYV